MPEVKRLHFNSLVNSIVVFGLLFLVAAAQAQQGGRERGGGGEGGGRRRGGGGRERPVQQKPGKPPEDRFLRVCKVLELSKEQLGKAVERFGKLQGDRKKIIDNLQDGGLESQAAKSKLKELDEQFETDFRDLLDAEQGKKMEELKKDGTLGDEWW